MRNLEPQTGRILVVDDEPEIRALLEAMLRRAGHAVITVANGNNALHALEDAGAFDLVLSDIVMPGMDGNALLEEIHRIDAALPVVMVTAMDDVAVAMAAIRRGAYDYLTKPFEREHLHASVFRALRHRRLTLENATYRRSLENLVAARTDMLRQAMSELERSYDITLEALGDALDLKDAETEGHSKRVTAYTIALARAMGMGSGDMRVVARGAFLHDIGKMAIPDAILRKPGPLTDIERLVMREHCERGYQMVRKIPFLDGASEIVYSHQERWDGSGYPRRLRGQQICMGARLFAVADTLDAITSDRPYRRARNFDAARAEIASCTGTQFDPEIVEVFHAMPNSLWEELRMEIELHARRFSPFAAMEAPERIAAALAALE